MKQTTLLLRLMSAAIAMLAAMPAWGQTLYDPEIAYTHLSGKTTSLYLANRDGSRAVRVHATADSIKGIDFAPSGNRIAFTDRAGLKILNYSASNTGITVSSIVLLVPGSIGAFDFSPDGKRILYRDPIVSPGAFLAINASGGGTPVSLHVDSGYIGLRWLRSDSLGSAFAYGKSFPNGPNLPGTYEIWTVLLDANDKVASAGPALSTTTQAFKNFEDFDIAHTRDALLISANYPTAIKIVEFDLVSGVVTPRVEAAYRSHYSADDSRIIYRTLTNLGSTEYINSLDVGTGDITRVFASKRGLGLIDTRP